MIVGKPDDEPTAELPPPSYQAALAAAPSPQPSPSRQPPPHPTDAKVPLPESSPTSPVNPYRPSNNFSTSNNKPRPSFLSRLWGPVGTALQVKQTTQSLVRDLVQSRPLGGSHDHPDRRLASDAARSVLDSCAAACEAQGLDLADVLREPFIEGHTSVYWAVLVHDSSSSRSGPDDDHTDSESLAEILIARALTSDAPPSPLSLEVRAACTLASDDALWRRLRCRFPRLDPPPAGPENLILSGGVNGKAVCDEASVEAKADGAFCVQVKMPMFQKRMRVVGSVGVEFIAGGRLFRLEFFVNGSKTRGDHTFADSAWIAQVSLLSPSAPTKVFSRLTIPPAPPPAPTPTSLPTPTGSTTTTTTTRRPAIVIKLVANEELYPDSRGVRVAVEDRALQHQGSAFLDRRGALAFVYEVQFTAPPRGQPECVIC